MQTTGVVRSFGTETIMAPALEDLAHQPHYANAEDLIRAKKQALKNPRNVLPYGQWESLSSTDIGVNAVIRSMAQQYGPVMRSDGNHCTVTFVAAIGMSVATAPLPRWEPSSSTMGVVFMDAPTQVDTSPMVDEDDDDIPAFALSDYDVFRAMMRYENNIVSMGPIEEYDLTVVIEGVDEVDAPIVDLHLFRS